MQKDDFLRRLMAINEDIEIAETVHLTCEKHGNYTNIRLVQKYSDGERQEFPLAGCPACNAEAEHKASMALYEASLHNEKFKSTKIPAKYAVCMLKNFVVEDANADFARYKSEVRQKCVDFIENKIRSLTLLGTTGLGKTHLVAAMLKGCVQTGREALYVVERKIYRDIHESYLGRKDLMTEGQVINLYSRIDVLGIDEIGRSSWTEHEAQILYEIIDRRDADNKKTIMAGNLLPPDFHAKFDDSFRRKLGAYELHCRWSKWEG